MAASDEASDADQAEGTKGRKNAGSNGGGRTKREPYTGGDGQPGRGR